MRGLIKNKVNSVDSGSGCLRVLTSLLKEAECYTCTTNGLDQTVKLIKDLDRGGA